MLKYLFIAFYDDGGSIYQTQEDKSRQRDDKNAFYDVKYAPLVPMDQLTAFALTDGRNCYLVDLTNGQFTVNGVIKHPADELGRKGRELIYFRRNTMCPQQPDLVLTVWHLGWKMGEIEHVLKLW